MPEVPSWLATGAAWALLFGPILLYRWLVRLGDHGRNVRVRVWWLDEQELDYLAWRDREERRNIIGRRGR